jgi:hypothetical protein
MFTPDVATTAHNIQTHQLLYRLGLAAHLVVTLTNVPLALIFYELFKVVNRRLALLIAFFILVATAIEAAGLVHEFTPLALLGSGPFASALPSAQLEALASLPGALSDASYHVYTVFFGLDIFGLAYLVLQSRFVPRAIGVLLAIDGLAYLVYSFTDLLVPRFAAHLVPWIQLPAPIAEGAFSLWLLVFGVNAELAHSLRAHVRTASEFGEPRAGRVDLREHGRVRGRLGESRADDAVDDAEAERAVGLPSMATVFRFEGRSCRARRAHRTDRRKTSSADGGDGSGGTARS